MTERQIQYGVMDIFSQYISLRQSGRTMEDSIYELQVHADVLSRGDRSQLGRLVQTWEARDGVNFKQASRRQPIRRLPTNEDEPPTRHGDTPIRNSVIRPIEPPRKVPRIRLIEPLMAHTELESDGDEETILCPNCGKTNPSQESYCYGCGELLPNGKISTKSLPGSENGSQSSAAAHFGPNATMIVIIHGAPKPLTLRPGANAELTIGRSSGAMPMRPDIDLAAYNAENLGVSRLHASLRRRTNLLTLEDLNSRNCTYINGQRLHPHEVRIVKDGDEIRLGKLTMKVVFKRE
jgi:hypothetical protein